MHTISAVIPAYNAEAYIERAIQSVLRQTQLPEEIIVVDDGSTDKTSAAVRQLSDEIKLIQQPNAGVGAARNAGIMAATGDWVAFLDADDEWLPKRLERQLAVLRRHPELVWVSGNYISFFCRSRRRDAFLNSSQLLDKVGQTELIDNFLNAFANGVRCFTGTMLIRRDVLLKTGLFRTGWKNAEDTDLWLRIAYDHLKVGFVHHPIAVHHMEIEQSLATNPKMYDFLKHFLESNLVLATDAGRREQFIPCARAILRGWVRSSMFDDRIYDVPKAIRDFDDLLTARYKQIARTLTISPNLTKTILQGLSWISQSLHLRRRTWHPCRRYKRHSATLTPISKSPKSPACKKQHNNEKK